MKDYDDDFGPFRGILAAAVIGACFYAFFFLAFL